jgi:hypothetical protein
VIHKQRAVSNWQNKLMDSTLFKKLLYHPAKKKRIYEIEPMYGGLIFERSDKNKKFAVRGYYKIYFWRHFIHVFLSMSYVSLSLLTGLASALAS